MDILRLFYLFSHEEPGAKGAMLRKMRKLRLWRAMACLQVVSVEGTFHGWTFLKRQSFKLPLVLLRPRWRCNYRFVTVGEWRKNRHICCQFTITVGRRQTSSVNVLAGESRLVLPVFPFFFNQEYIWLLFCSVNV